MGSMTRELLKTPRLDQESIPVASFNNSSAPSCRKLTNQAYPNNLQIGTIVYFRPDQIVEGYPKRSEVRPGIVMAIWKDKSGRVDTLEIVTITTKQSFYAVNLKTSQFAYDQAVNNRPNKEVKLTDIYFCKNNLTHLNRPTNIIEVITDIWPDLLTRRALALLGDNQARIFGNKPSSHLTRHGYAFSNIHPENIGTKTWQPDILSNGAKHNTQTPQMQADIDKCARFAVFFSRKMYRNGNKNWSFPPYAEWPNPVPETRFIVHDRSRAPKNDLK